MPLNRRALSKRRTRKSGKAINTIYNEYIGKVSVNSVLLIIHNFYTSYSQNTMNKR